MSYQESSGYCKRCKSYRLIRRPGTNHLLHFLLTLFTVGLWFPIWVLTSIQFGGWKCSSCGKATSRSWFS